jgi:hypothetical protein
MRNQLGMQQHKERIKQGAAIARNLVPYMSAEEVGKKLGISQQAVREIECLALWKIAHRMRQLDNLTHPLDSLDFKMPSQSLPEAPDPEPPLLDPEDQSFAHFQPNE